MRKKHLSYSLLTAHCKCNETRHAQTVMKELGITYQLSVPQTIADCWQFFNCENVPEKLPDYLCEMQRDPMTLIGYGLSREEAEAIMDNSNG